MALHAVAVCSDRRVVVPLMSGAMMKDTGSVSTVYSDDRQHMIPCDLYEQSQAFGMPTTFTTRVVV